MHRRATLVASIALVVGLAAPSDAPACSCVPLEITAETFRDSDGAIIGRFVGRDPTGPQQADYRYRVRRVFRGRQRIARGGLIEVRSAADGAACGLKTPPGRRDGLFLERSAGDWTATLCSTVSPRQMRRAAEREGLARTAGCPG